MVWKDGVVGFVLLGLFCHGVVGFCPSTRLGLARVSVPLDSMNVSPIKLSQDDDNSVSDGEADDTHEGNSHVFSRRDTIGKSLMGAAAGTLLSSKPAFALFGFGQDDEPYSPAIRPMAYRVDSTRPPSLLPLSARKEMAVLQGLGKGLGTSKDAVIDDRINFNNMLNKAVFGAIDKVSSIVAPNTEEAKSGPGYASFVCMGVPKNTTSEDVDLSISLLTLMLKGRNSKANTALGLSFAPLSAQSALDDFVQNGDEQSLADAMTQSSVSDATLQLYLPLLRFAQSRSMALLALAPEAEDVSVVRRDGLQNVDVDRRAKYVEDSEGFISLTQDPKFKLYTDRSLVKDFDPKASKSDNQGNFFAERILVHEAAATAAARYATKRPDSLVAMVAPIPDVRFLGGINGRIPRLCRYFNGETNKVDEEAVTTVLLNPTAKETLSLSRFLRLEIGTAPETWQYQSKVADYLWFSKMPKVNMLPRLMNG